MYRLANLCRGSVLSGNCSRSNGDILLPRYFVVGDIFDGDIFVMAIFCPAILLPRYFDSKPILSAHFRPDFYHLILLSPCVLKESGFLLCWDNFVKVTQGTHFPCDILVTRCFLSCDIVAAIF